MRAALWAVAVAFGLCGVASGALLDVKLFHRDLVPIQRDGASDDFTVDPEQIKYRTGSIDLAGWPSRLVFHIRYNRQICNAGMSIWIERKVCSGCENIRLWGSVCTREKSVADFRCSPLLHMCSPLTKFMGLVNYVAPQFHWNTFIKGYNREGRAFTVVFQSGGHIDHCNVGQVQIPDQFQAHADPRPLIGEVGTTADLVGLPRLTGGFGGHDGGVGAQGQREDEAGKLEAAEPDAAPGYLIGLAHTFDRAPLGAQVESSRYWGSRQSV